MKLMKVVGRLFCLSLSSHPEKRATAAAAEYAFGFPADEVSEISDTFWASSFPMNGSASEWAFEKFLEEVVSPPPQAPPPITSNQLPVSSAQSSTSKLEEVDEIKKPDLLPNFPPPPPPSTAANNSDKHRELLKSKLNLACAAVALTRAQSVAPPPQLKSGVHHNKEEMRNDVIVLGVDATSPLGIPALPAVPKKLDQTTSGSSKDDSDDDDELEGDHYTKYP